MNSKKSSLVSILASMVPSPNLLVVSESHMKFDTKVNITGYNSYSRNRKDKSQGGIVTSIRDDEAINCLKVSEGQDSNEYIITRHNMFQTPINVINLYSSQENRTPVNEIRDQWQEIVEEVIKIEARKENMILLGDFNKHVGDIIEGNHAKITEGGKLIRELLINGDFVLLNSLTSKVKGGPFTRIDPSEPENDDKKSCIDFIIVSSGLVKYVEEIDIDKGRQITPCHAMKNGKLTYPDHHAIVTKFRNIPLKKMKNKSVPKTKKR